MWVRMCFLTIGKLHSIEEIGDENSREFELLGKLLLAMLTLEEFA
jgi:hypothetical protein